MIKKKFFSQLTIAICFLSISFFRMLAQESRNSEEEAWTMISSDLECFLIDPVANFHLIKRVDNLNYWTFVYRNLKGNNYLEKLFSKQFSISDIDETKLGVILHLLKAFSSPTSYRALEPIISRIIEISSAKPEWFARNLLLRDDWREIARLIIKADIENILGQRKGLIDILSDLKDPEITEELKDLFNELDNEKRNEFDRFEEFMKDPAGNLDKIKDIYNLCAVMGNRDMLYLDEHKVLRPENNSILLLQDWIKKDTDERKIKVLFHLMNHCDSAYHSEVIGGIAEDVFLECQPKFVSALKNEPNWRSIMLAVSYGLYYKDKELKRTLCTLGNSDFEMRMKSQLEFLRKYIDYENSQNASGIAAGCSANR